MKYLLALLLSLIMVSGAQAANKLLAFGATWCSPCHQMEPTLKKLEKRGVKVIRIDVDKQPELAAKYGVTELPTYISVDEKGQVKAQAIGKQTEAGLLTLLKVTSFIIKAAIWFLS